MKTDIDAVANVSVRHSTLLIANVHVIESTNTVANMPLKQYIRVANAP